LIEYVSLLFGGNRKTLVLDGRTVKNASRQTKDPGSRRDPSCFMSFARWWSPALVR
jgi:hypothetical protein